MGKSPVAQSRRIRGREAILQKIVFELRYRYGFTYLDKCGRTINTLMREDSDWILPVDQPNPQNAPLVNLSDGCVFNFNARKYDLSLERPLGGEPLSSEDVKKFIDHLRRLHAITVDQLGLAEFTRIGFRAWYVFACDSREDAEQWLSGLGCSTVSPTLLSSFKSKIDAIGLSVVMAGEDRMYRIAFNGVEVQGELDLGLGTLKVRPRELTKGQRQKLLEQETAKARLRRNPEFAAMIDIDAYQESPSEVDPSDFVETSYSRYLDQLSDATETGR